jgi:hypothetical protein
VAQKPSKVDIMKIGDKFGRLTVVGLIPDRKNPKAECLCSCGNVVQPQRGALRNGRATSCGCSRREKLAVSGVTHGLSKTPEYSVYRGIVDRCRNPNNPHFGNYGGRGLKVAYSGFEDFLADVGPKPAGAWIDRKDNERGYEPGNCAWVTPTTNQKNKRVSKFWTVDGRTFDSSVEAAKAIGVTPSAIVRGCNGYHRNGKSYPPRKGWSCALKYQSSIPDVRTMH